MMIFGNNITLFLRYNRRALTYSTTLCAMRDICYPTNNKHLLCYQCFHTVKRLAQFVKNR